MRDSAALARRAGVRMHTHLAETVDEEEFCRADVRRHARRVRRGPRLARRRRVARALRAPLGRRDRPLRRHRHRAWRTARRPTRGSGRASRGCGTCSTPGCRSGSAWTASASNESGRMVDELHQALLAARFRGGPLALTARESLRAATVGGARCLGPGGRAGHARGGQARRPRGLAGRRARRAAASPTRSARSCSARPRWRTCSSAATRSCATASCARPTPRRSPPRQAARRPIAEFHLLTASLHSPDGESPFS